MVWRMDWIVGGSGMGKALGSVAAQLMNGKEVLVEEQKIGVKSVGREDRSGPVPAIVDLPELRRFQSGVPGWSNTV